MRKPPFPTVTRALLKRAVMLLDGYEDYPLHEQWTEARHALLTELTDVLGVDSVRAAIEALKPRYQSSKTTRAARNAEIKRRYEGGEDSDALAIEYDLCQASITQIVHALNGDVRRAGVRIRVPSQPKEGTTP